MTNGIMDEAKRLYDFGFGVHWIKRGSKAPLQSGWSSGERQSIEELERTWKKGYGLGVRLGRASKVYGNSVPGYLVNLDLDIKSKDPEAKQEALSHFKKLFPGIAKSAPVVKTGRGLRFICMTREPLASFRIVQSDTKCKVLLDEKTVPPAQKAYIKEGLITKKELLEGWRIRPAWEIDFLSDGKQAVLPPSIHPGTKKPYRWLRGIKTPDDIPLIELPDAKHVQDSRRGDSEKEHAFLKSWRPVPIDIEISSLPESTIRMIKDGEGLKVNRHGNEDPSASCLAAAMMMLKHGFTREEILSVLTDRRNFLGETAYSKKHRNTNNRRVAAAWVFRYCVLKGEDELHPAKAFEDVPIEPPKKLSEEAAKKQQEVLLPLSSRLRRTKQGDVLPSFENTNLILGTLFGNAFEFDSFSNREYLIEPTPFAKKGEKVSDRMLLKIKDWLITQYGLEASIGTIMEVVSFRCQENTKDSAVSMLDNLPAWDGRDRLKTWMHDHFAAENDKDYVGEVFTKWLTAAVARVYEPGLKFDWMLILEGAQGKGKSLFGQILFGADYWHEQLGNLELRMADAVLQMQGKLCVEFPELMSMRKASLEGIKAFITRQVDTVRAPYGKTAMDLPRRAVFYGTTNESVYLKDPTGNRRFNPVKVGALDVKQLQKDREQLLAEARFLYLNGLIEHFYLSEKSNAHAEILKEERKVYSDTDHLVDLLEDFIDSGINFPWKKFKIADLFSVQGPFGNLKYEAKNSREARSALKKLGATSQRTKRDRYWSLDTVTSPTRCQITGTLLN